MYPKSVYPVTYVVLNSPYDWFRLIFEEEKIFNLKILCYLSYKCHHCYLRDPCKASHVFLWVHRTFPSQKQRQH